MLDKQGLEGLLGFRFDFSEEVALQVVIWLWFWTVAHKYVSCFLVFAVY